MRVGDSQLTGIVSHEVKLSPWMDKLAEQEKNAIKDDLDEVANPELLGEGDNFNGEEQYIAEELSLPTNYASTDFNDHTEYDNNDLLNPSTFKISGINTDIDNYIKTIPEGTMLSNVATSIAKEFTYKISERYIKNNYIKLAALFPDDLQLGLGDNHGIFERVAETNIYLKPIESRKVAVKYTSDDVKKKATNLLLTNGPEEVLVKLANDFGEKLLSETFTKKEFKAFTEKQGRFVFDTIDNYVRDNILRNSSDLKASLTKKFGSVNAKEYLSKSHMTRLSNFIKSRNDGSRLDRTGDIDKSKDINILQANNRKIDTTKDDIELTAKNCFLQKKSMDETIKILNAKFGEKKTQQYIDNTSLHKLAGFIQKSVITREDDVKHHVPKLQSRTGQIDYKKITKEAYLKLHTTKSLDEVVNNLISKYGKKAINVVMAEEGPNLKKAEHKLGYFYVDANCFENCDQMVNAIKHNGCKAMLLKKKAICSDCVNNCSGICSKSSLILASNPLNISRRDGKMIIKSVEAMKWVNNSVLEGYLKNLEGNKNNVSVIKAFLERVKEAVQIEQNPIRFASNKLKKDDGNEFRNTFNELDLNHVDFNGFTKEVKPLDIILATLGI